MTQLEMNDQSMLDLTKSASEYAQLVYEVQRTYTDEEQKKQFWTIHITFVQFLDEECELVAMEYEGGSIRPMIMALRRAELLNARIKDLKVILKDRQEKFRTN